MLNEFCNFFNSNEWKFSFSPSTSTNWMLRNGGVYVGSMKKEKDMENGEKIVPSEGNETTEQQTRKNWNGTNESVNEESSQRSRSLKWRVEHHTQHKPCSESNLELSLSFVIRSSHKTDGNEFSLLNKTKWEMRGLSTYPHTYFRLKFLAAFLLLSTADHAGYRKK